MPHSCHPRPMSENVHWEMSLQALHQKYTTPKFLNGGLSVLPGSLMVPKMEEEAERKELGNLNCFDKGREKIASVLA